MCTCRRRKKESGGFSCDVYANAGLANIREVENSPSIALTEECVCKCAVYMPKLPRRVASAGMISQNVPEMQRAFLLKACSPVNVTIH